MRWTKTWLASLPLCVAMILATSERSRADMVYLALGDSVTYGIDPSSDWPPTPSYADQGFVKPVADYLASQNGGVRPDVLNLAIPGELSTSFFSAVAPPGWMQRIPQLNLNYANPATSQFDLMASSIASIHAAGDTVGYVSFLIGGNDLFYLIANPAFQAATSIEQQMMVGATLATIQANYLAVLDQLAVLAPEAKLILPGYYNPFPSFLPEHDFYDSVLASFNPTIEANAALYGATYVDFYSPIAGQELLLTNIGIEDIHPNQLGYSALGDAVIRAVAVPEPASLLMMTIGGLGLLNQARRRRATTGRRAG